MFCITRTRHLRSVEDVDNLCKNWVAFALILLADELDIAEFSEIKVSLLLQAVDRHLQVHQLHEEEESAMKSTFLQKSVLVQGYSDRIYFLCPVLERCWFQKRCLCTCWLSSMSSTSLPPFRNTGVLRFMLVGAELIGRGGVGMVLGTVGDVLWGPMRNNKEVSKYKTYRTSVI